jgi:hypothetical protein
MARMKGWINAGFGNVLGKVWLDKIHNLGFAGIRTDIDIRWKLVVDELGMYNKLSPVFLFGGGYMEGWTKDDFISYTTLVARHIIENGYFDDTTVYFEIGNEPDIAVREWRENPKWLNTTFWECYQAVKSIDKGIEIVTGGVSNLTQNALKWQEDFLLDKIPQNAIVGFHRYPNKYSITKPHDGFATREHEWNRLKSLTGEHRLFCTETGLSMGPYRVARSFPLCWLNENYWLTQQEQGTALEHEWNFYRRRDVVGMVWYQHLDGPDRNNIYDNYGLYTKNGVEKYGCSVVRRILQ